MDVKIRLIDNRFFKLAKYKFSTLNEETRKVIDKDLNNFAITIFNLVNIFGPKAIVLECSSMDVQHYLIKSINLILKKKYPFEKLGGDVLILESLPFYSVEPISLRSKVKSLGQFENKLGIGFDIGANTIRAVCIDGYGNILKHTETKTKREEGYRAVIKQIQAILNEDILEVIKRESILSIGIGIPGGIGPLFVKHMIIMEDWDNFDLRAEIERTIRIPTFVENDANVIAIAEKEISRIEGDFLSITLGENVGGGIVINDRVVHGENYFAGELGHIIIDDSKDAPICGCGNKGCLEAHISRVFKNFKDGNLDLLDEIAKLSAKAIQTIVNITGIDKIILGSIEKKFGYLFYQTVQDSLRTLFPPEILPVKVYESCMERLPEPNCRFVGAIGAAIMGMQKIGEVSEKVILLIKENDTEMGIAAAQIIAEQIKRKPNTVLGLATGSTPISTYKELVRMHQEEDLDFSQVITFNLDEYFPIKKSNPQSYYYFMHYWLFNHINISPKNIHIPNGDISEKELENHCFRYEEKMKNAGGIDIQLLGIGGSYYNEEGVINGGHIGFNEAGSDFFSKTRKVALAEKTRTDNARFFKGMEEIPHSAITMGVGTILDAKRIILLASGEHKAQILKESIEGDIARSVPASALQTHPNTTFLIERRSASTLSRITHPWLFFNIDWTKIDKQEIDKAIIWLSLTTRKPIGRLVLQDFVNNFLSDLLRLERYNVSDLTRSVMNRINNKIIYKEKFPRDKNILIISTRPGDNALIGDILYSCFNNNNNVKVVNMVSGNLNVKNTDLIDFCERIGLDITIKEQIKNNTLNRNELLQLKTLLRKTEAVEFHAYLGISSENLYFLNLPFYEVRNIEERVITDDDINPLIDILTKERPDIIFTLDGITDPHGVKTKVVEILNTALVKSNLKSTEIWLYKTIMEDFSIPDGDLILPFTEKEMDLKIMGIKRLQSQNTPIFPGIDSRPLWYRIKERNQKVGSILTTIGLVSKEYRYGTVCRLSHFEDKSQTKKFFQSMES